MITFDNQGDVTIAPTAGINAPPIGGQTLASLTSTCVRPTEPNDDSFVAAWTTLPVIGGIGFEYDFADQLTIISGPPPQGGGHAPETLTVSNGLGSGPGSAAAIATANGYAGNTTIQFDDDVSTINLTSPGNHRQSECDTVGPLHCFTINGNGNQVFSIDGESNVSISGLTIEGGSAFSGGGILNFGTLRLSNDILSGNTAIGNGGGIDNAGTLTMSGVNITDNNAKTGGGIYNAGTATLSNGIIYQNTVSGLTGGIYNTS